MEEKDIRVPETIKKAGQEQRYTFIVAEGRRILSDSAITNPSKTVSSSDIALINRLNQTVAPSKATPITDTTPQIFDPSTFDNFTKPGGPLEHINLTVIGSQILFHEIISFLHPVTTGMPEWKKRDILEIGNINPYHLAASAGLHDFGRNVTHIFGRTELVGDSLLNKIGVRRDIISILPQEKVMLTPEEQDINDVIKSMPAEAVIIRLTDEFAKRKPGAQRLFTREDFTEATQEEWARRYVSRPESGAPSDHWMRKRIPLHNKNMPRYFEALNNWLIELTGRPLKYYTDVLNDHLASTLATPDS